MPLNPYQTNQYQDFSGQPQKKSKMPIIVIIAIAVVVIIAILAFLYVIGSGEKDAAERGETLSEQERLEILNSLRDENIIRPSVEERRVILESLSAPIRPSDGNGNGSSASAGEIQGLTEEERLQVIQSLQFQ